MLWWSEEKPWGGWQHLLDVYLLEDNPEELKQLAEHVQAVTKSLQIHAKINSFQSVEKLQQAMPMADVHNVYILDVDVDGDAEAGLKLSRFIRQSDMRASIIFLTVHDEFLPTTYKYQVEALDFIVKNQDSIHTALTRDFEKIAQKQHIPSEYQMLVLRSHYEVFKIPVQNILYFQSNPDNTHQAFLFTVYNERWVVNMSLHQLEGRSPEFFRVHRSYLVNLMNVQSFNLKQHRLKFYIGDVTVPVSRLRSRKLVELLHEGQLVHW